MNYSADFIAVFVAQAPLLEAVIPVFIGGQLLLLGLRILRGGK